jgi:hypothetical protein
MSVDIAGIQAPYTTSVVWLLGSHVVTMNCPAYESKLRQHPLLVGFDVEVKPDKVLLDPEERKQHNMYFPKAAHIHYTKEDAERLKRKLKMVYNLKTSTNKPEGKDLRFVPTILEPGLLIKLHQDRNTDNFESPSGTSEATPGDDLGLTITVPTSSVTHLNPVNYASNTSSLTGTTPTDPMKSQTTPTKTIQHQSL